MHVNNGITENYPKFYIFNYEIHIRQQPTVFPSTVHISRIRYKVIARP
jgi:hypothetical protein